MIFMKKNLIIENDQRDLGHFAAVFSFLKELL